MDEIDRKIIDLLRKDCRKSNVEISKTVGLSEGAVRGRVKDLVDKGIIERFTILTKSPDLLKVLVEITTDPSKPTFKIADQITALRYVEHVYELTGEVDIIALVAAASHLIIDDIIEKIRSIQGVMNTQTHLILKEH
jgi:DNA-binding Lrp family transcriptional regulator